jgi:phage baseplate assembly protein W
MNDFIGRRLSFPVRLDDRNLLAMVGGDTAIRQSLYIIIMTVPGERVMRPDFGCQIHELIFYPANAETAALAERYVREAVMRWEPRITLHDVIVTPSGGAVGELWIELRYEIKGQNDPRSMVFPYYLVQ